MSDPAQAPVQNPLPPQPPAAADDGSAASVGAVHARIHEAMERRMATQPEPVRRLLQQKLEQARTLEAQRSTSVAPDPQARRDRPDPTPLGQLNAHVRAAAAARVQSPLPGESHDPDELASVRGFRRAWARGRSLEQLDRALVRKPVNAGPLNSHALVLQALSLMRDLSPDYLRRFVAGVETLQWLERAGGPLPREAAKAARRGTRASPKTKK